MTLPDAAVGLLILAAALLYSSVGHGGASAYLAVMALAGLTPAEMRPAALSLNVLVAGVAAIRFGRAGHFSLRLLWPFAAASIPAAYVGGLLTLPDRSYGWVLGLVLLYSAVRMVRTAANPGVEMERAPPLALALAAGAAIGLVSGLLGVGGGIFLSPLILLAGWANARTTAAVSAVFIVVNSVAGLAGSVTAGASVPSALPFWAAAALAGGWIGAGYGSRRLAAPNLRRLLAAVLAVAALKLFFAY